MIIFFKSLFIITLEGYNLEDSLPPWCRNHAEPWRDFYYI